MPECSDCGVELTEDNCQPSYLERGWGKCRDCVAAYMRQYRAKNKEKFKDRWRKYRENHREEVRKRTRKWKHNLRMEVLTAYSPNLTCSVCGYGHPMGLTIDHKDHDGNEHRKELVGFNGGGSHEVLKWARDNDFPDNLRVLCMNCQLVREKIRRKVECGDLTIEQAHKLAPPNLLLLEE